jgi:hypothetical protein
MAHSAMGGQPGIANVNQVPSEQAGAGELYQAKPEGAPPSLPAAPTAPVTPGLLAPPSGPNVNPQNLQGLFTHTLAQPSPHFGFPGKGGATGSPTVPPQSYIKGSF